MIKFEINCQDDYNLDASLVIYMQMLKEDGTAASKTDTTTVEAFWGRFFTSVKVKKYGDVNILNTNSDDVITQFNLYMHSKVTGYSEFDRDMLTTSKRFAVDKAQRDSTPTEDNGSLQQRIALFADKLSMDSRYVIPLRCLCNIFNIRGPIPPDVTLSLE